ncbi:alpha/beta fold hydrolase [Massilia sp. CF038]|uniref:alpha/beta fold hydrolase n=1 Tax=Massilia sp. CF038 TaxID=1881045 RepID=UPI0009194376|nr:alpha/beta hydrolase [Massilia sp. CF038]SHH08592.1 sigma-B regulation protein RsbQ [Massilia sp. CF038]
MSALIRHHVHCSGSGAVTLVFAHGFGCDQTMWRFLVPHFEHCCRIVLYDLTGCGQSDLGAYDYTRHASLHGHADDLLEVIDAACDGPVIFIGHSVSAMIGMLAAIRRPQRFLAQVMLGPSPCYINDDDYVGGFNAEDIDGMLALMQRQLDDWTTAMAPVIMGATAQPALQAELASRFRRNDPAIMRHFARVTFLSDHRRDLAASRVPSLILQCSDDMIAPQEVGQYLHAHLAGSTLAIIGNVGHCPHMSAPSASVDAVTAFFKVHGLI